MRDGIYLAVCRVQRRHDQCAAKQAFRIAYRGHADIDLRTGARERRQGGGNDHRRHVLGTECFVSDIDAQPLKQAGHDLFGKGRVSQAVARTVQADDQAITDQVVAADAVDIGQILDPNRRSKARSCKAEQNQQKI